MRIVAMACGKAGDLQKGQEIHGEMESLGLFKGKTKNRYVGSALVDMYSRCGSLEKARNVFDVYPVQDVVAWNTLVSRHVDYGFHEEAILCFKQMQLECISSNATTFTVVLKSCIKVNAVEFGKELCRDIGKLGLLNRNLSADIGNTMILMYAKFGLIDLTREIFSNLQDRDVVSWNTLIAGYADQVDCGQEAFRCLEQMQASGFAPDAMTFVSLLKVCSTLRDINNGKLVHSEIEKRGLSTQNVIVCNALIDMYARCGYVSVAEHLFHRISLPDTYTWNVLMTGYSENGYYTQAIECFESMKLHDVPLDVVTFISCLKACGSLQATSTGLTMHSEIIKLGFLEEDPEVGNVLVDMYVKCGLLEKAQKVFGRLLDQSIVSWTSLIKGYLEHERADKAVECFEKMQLDGIVPDSVAFVAGLQACGSLGAVKKGEELYIEMEQRGLLQQDAVCGKAVVDMYAKCCCLEKAQQVFYRLPFRDVVAWTTLMAAYTQLGKSASVFPMYHRMVEEGNKPDEVVFTVTLAACSQMGLFGKFETYLETMAKDYGIAPTHKHYMCAVDLFSFTGQLENAFRTIRKMPCCHTRRAWNNLLCACRYSGNIVIGRHAFEHVS